MKFLMTKLLPKLNTFTGQSIDGVTYLSGAACNNNIITICGENNIAFSSNFRDWVVDNNFYGRSVAYCDCCDKFAIAANDGKFFIGTASSTYGVIRHEFEEVEFDVPSGSFLRPLYDVACNFGENNSIFISVGGSQRVDEQDRVSAMLIHRITDGTPSTEYFSPLRVKNGSSTTALNKTITSIAYGNGKFVAVAGNSILYNQDASLNNGKWIKVNASGEFSNITWESVDFCNNMFIICGYGGAIAITEDCSSFEYIQTNMSNFTPFESSVAYYKGNYYFCAGNKIYKTFDKENVLTTYDVKLWSTSPIVFKNVLMAVHYTTNGDISTIGLT